MPKKVSTKKVTKKKEKPEKTQKTVIKELAQLLSDRTQKWFEDNDLIDSKKKSKYSKRAKEFDKIISSGNFGCQEKYVRKLIEKLIDEKIPESKDEEIALIPGLVLIPTSASNGHGYELEEPIIFVGDRGTYKFLRKNGFTDTKKLPNVKKQFSIAVRAADIDEIEDMLQNLSKKNEFATQLLSFVLESY